MSSEVTVRSTSSRTSRTSTASRTAFQNDAPIFAQGRGKLREKIIVDILRVDEQPLKTNINHHDAYKYVYRRSLGLESSNLHGIALEWQGHPVLVIRVSKPIDIDSLPARFSFIKTTNKDTADEIDFKYDCEVRGVRDPNAQRPQEEFPKAKWVTLEGTWYDMDKPDLLKWMDFYGKPLSDLVEDTIKYERELDDPSEDENISFGSGRHLVKVRLERDIPQYLPCLGKKIKIYYSGIPGLCTNCYKNGHYKANCKNIKVRWIDHVERFIDENHFIPLELFGRWPMVISTQKRQDKINLDKMIEECKQHNGPDQSEETETTPEAEITKSLKETTISTETSTTPKGGPPTKKRGRPSKGKNEKPTKQ